MKRCGGCKFFRDQVEEGVDPCLLERRCVGDPRLAELAKGDLGDRVSHERLRALSEQINLGFLRAERQVRAREYPSVDGGDVLVALIRDIHRDVFGATGLRFAGRFREPGETEALVDCKSHQFTGAPAEEILRRLLCVP